jgi:hypothetical protein
MAKKIQHQEHHASAKNTAGKESHPQSQSPELDQKSGRIPIITKAGGQRTIRGRAGPRTAQGKKRSRFNALKHGLFFKSLLLKGESRAEYVSLLDGLLGDLQPQGKFETTLAENVAALLWRKRRLFQSESAEISEKLECMIQDSYLNQYVEAWDRARAAITSGGLLRNPNNPIVLRKAIEMLEALRAVVTTVGFYDDFQLLERLYGRDQDGKMPHGLCVKYQLFLEKARASGGITDKSEEANNRQIMVAAINSEIQRLTIVEQTLEQDSVERIAHKLSAALIPGQEVSDRLLRYETHLSREIDRILNRLERLQRLRRGQPLPPQVDLNINH